jgi:hypothetical protein
MPPANARAMNTTTSHSSMRRRSSAPNPRAPDPVRSSTSVVFLIVRSSCVSLRYPSGVTEGELRSTASSAAMSSTPRL